jgi:hypothetical protein
MAETKIKSSGLSANISVGNLTLTGTTSVSGNIIPTSNNAINLGSPSFRFGSLYLSGNTIDLGGAQITTTASGDLSFNTASGNVAITANTVSFLTTVANTVSDPGNVSFDSNVRVQPGIDKINQEGTYNVYRVNPQTVDTLRSKINQKVSYNNIIKEVIPKSVFFLQVNDWLYNG